MSLSLRPRSAASALAWRRRSSGNSIVVFMSPVLPYNWACGVASRCVRAGLERYPLQRLWMGMSISRPRMVHMPPPTKSPRTRCMGGERAHAICRISRHERSARDLSNLGDLAVRSPLRCCAGPCVHALPKRMAEACAWPRAGMSVRLQPDGRQLRCSRRWSALLSGLRVPSGAWVGGADRVGIASCP